MKKDGIQTRNRKLASKGKKKRGSVVDFFSPFVNINSDRLPFAAYSNMSNTTNSPYTGLSANPVNAGIKSPAAGQIPDILNKKESRNEELTVANLSLFFWLSTCCHHSH